VALEELGSTLVEPAVTFAIERPDTSGVKPVAVFRFLGEDWSPWIAVLRMRERWPELLFEMRAGYLEMEGRAGDGELPMRAGLFRLNQSAGHILSVIRRRM
jgi:hypothetical protein